MQSIRYNKYLPIALMYFFVNTPEFFPQGLMLTSVISPLLYIWLLLKRERFVLETFLAVLFPFFLANVYVGINMKDFAVSGLLVLTVYTAAYAFAVGIREMKSLESLLETIIKLNLLLAFVGILVRFSPISSLMWQTYRGTGGPNLVRFQGLAYEPAQYSLLVTPLILYSYWRLVYRRDRKSVFLFVATVIPMLMAFSFGVMSANALGVVIVHLVYGKGFDRIKWMVIIAVVLAIGYVVLPVNNSLKVRAIAIATGNDGSENARTSAAYFAASEMASHKSWLFGVGLGEGKEYSEYTLHTTGHIVSAVADTLGELGITGLILRFGLEIFFFIKTKPYRDPFRLNLFITMFFLQFGASFDLNIVEYITWILAFSQSVGFFSRQEPEPARRLVFAARPQLT
jgi:hypothetical protein